MKRECTGSKLAPLTEWALLHSQVALAEGSKGKTHVSVDVHGKSYFLGTLGGKDKQFSVRASRTLPLPLSRWVGTDAKTRLGDTICTQWIVSDLAIRERPSCSKGEQGNRREGNSRRGSGPMMRGFDFDASCTFPGGSRADGGVAL